MSIWLKLQTRKNGYSHTNALIIFEL